MTRRVTAGAWMLLALVASGCGETDRPGSAAEEVRPAAATGGAAVAVEGPGPWTAESSAGTRVTVTPEAVPVMAGAVRVEIALEGGATGIEPRSVDLVSPTMPAHGIVRFPVTSGAAGTWIASVEIPMLGRWALYVNLDEGGDAAGFAFDVGPAPGDAQPHHAP